MTHVIFAHLLPRIVLDSLLTNKEEGRSCWGQEVVICPAPAGSYSLVVTNLQVNLADTPYIIIIGNSSPIMKVGGRWGGGGGGGSVGWGAALVNEMGFF